MKKILFLISSFFFTFSTNFAQGPRLSNSSTISVLTFGPGQEELYSAFGHSAIRLYDSINNIDIAFNYGVFDFNQPHFYLNFARGYLYYMVDAYSYPDFRDYYVEHNRFVHEQILNLTPEQKQKVADFLVWNIQPKNKTYRYDYFYNNCATKIRDAFESAIPNEVAFDSTFIKTDYTIRNLTDIYLSQQPWGDLGIDICLGLPMDKKARPFEYMFLPDYIESSFDHAINKSVNQPLVKKKVIVYQSVEEKTSFHWFHPWIIFGIIFLIGSYITWKDWQQKKLSRWFDVIFFATIGAIGILLLFLWTMTDHQAAAKNFNLFWAFPTHFIVAVVLLKKNQPKWITHYFLFNAILTAILLGVWYLLPQSLNVFLIPIVGVSLLRSLVNFIIRKQNP
ncbi:MAG TPA: hypothetical protein DGG95_12010 [Cytophagales bacterium]|jgi:hypothetical protein|nr:hypothetical protein [Cytophagales bacterium]